MTRYYVEVSPNAVGPPAKFTVMQVGIIFITGMIAAFLILGPDVTDIATGFAGFLGWLIIKHIKKNPANWGIPEQVLNTLVALTEQKLDEFLETQSLDTGQKQNLKDWLKKQ